LCFEEPFGCCGGGGDKIKATPEEAAGVVLAWLNEMDKA
jgi:hypothetical protein